MKYSINSGNKLAINPEYAEAYKDDMTKLLTIEIKDVKLPKINLTDIEDLKLEGTTLLQLGDLIVDNRLIKDE
jgi:hypothetical protein